MPAIPDNQHDGGPHSDDPKNVLDHVRLFFEYGDEYDVRFCPKKEGTRGSLDFTRFTSILRQRGATLLHDGRYFHTPALERYLDEETVCTNYPSIFPFSALQCG
jgi:hypothetical protein